jgi:hypothetical protein
VSADAPDRDAGAARGASGAVFRTISKSDPRDRDSADFHPSTEHSSANDAVGVAK